MIWPDHWWSMTTAITKCQLLQMSKLTMTIIIIIIIINIAVKHHHQLDIWSVDKMKCNRWKKTKSANIQCHLITWIIIHNHENEWMNEWCDSWFIRSIIMMMYWNSCRFIIGGQTKKKQTNKRTWKISENYMIEYGCGQTNKQTKCMNQIIIINVHYNLNILQIIIVVVVVVVVQNRQFFSKYFDF